MSIVQNSNLTVNYNYFYDRIQRGEISMDELDAICRLEIINPTESDDNPQLIFESLNSTGLALSEGDKIRTSFWWASPPSSRKDYEKYWNRIEECTGYDVSSFIRDYLSMKQAAIPQISRVYAIFKTYGKNAILRRKICFRTCWNMQNFIRFCVLATTSAALNSCIYRLNRLETAVTRPFFLEVLRLNAENALSLDEVTQIFLTCENYVFRRLICDLPTNALNKIFLMLHKEIMRYDGSADQYFEKFKFAMLLRRSVYASQMTLNLRRFFCQTDVYDEQQEQALFVWEAENHGTSEDKAVWDHIDRGDYSIEHIMPQHLTPAWVEALGDDYELSTKHGSTESPTLHWQHITPSIATTPSLKSGYAKRFQG